MNDGFVVSLHPLVVRQQDRKRQIVAIVTGTPCEICQFPNPSSSSSWKCTTKKTAIVCTNRSSGSIPPNAVEGILKVRKAPEYINSVQFWAPFVCSDACKA
jgi:hypothetical protein